MRLTIFTREQYLHLLVEREAVRKGIRCEFATVKVDQPWACPLSAAYVGPPSIRPDQDDR